MGKRLRLGLCARGRSECSLSFSRRGSMGEEVDFVGDGAAKVIERFANIGRVIVGFIGVLGA